MHDFFLLLPPKFEIQELKKLRDQVSSEVQLRSELDEKVAKMNQLLTTGQEALQQEKKTVEMLRQQLLVSKSVSTNGQDQEVSVT